MNFCIMNHGGVLHYYKIAEVVLKSVYSLPSFSAFACECGTADVELGMTQELPLPGTDQESWRSVHQQAVDWAEGSACLGRLTTGGAPEINVNLPTERASARGRGSRVFDNYSDHLIRLSFDINPGNDHLNSFLILRDAIYLTMLNIDTAGL